MAESIRFGIVSTSDMYFFIDAMFNAIKDSGAKNNIGRSISQFDDSNPKELPSYKEMERVYRDYHNYDNGRIKIDCSLHSEYTTKPWTCEAVADYAKKNNAIIQVHVSESISEHEDCIKRYGKTPTEYLYDRKVFDTKAIAAHCIWVTPKDMDILKEKNVTVASNPVSNLKLASGVCNVPELLRRKINVAIGTDSVASNNSLNFIEEMKIFAIASKMMYKDQQLLHLKKQYMRQHVQVLWLKEEKILVFLKRDLRLTLLFLISMCLTCILFMI